MIAQGRLCQPHKWLFACAKGIGHLTNKKIRHLSNAKILRMAVASGGFFVCMHPGKLAVLQEWTKRGKIMTSARLSSEALESCFRRVICKGVKERKPPASTAQAAFLCCQTS